MSQKTRKKWIWGVITLMMILGITFLHYSTHVHHHPLHALYRKLYYLPILLGAFHFGFKGALVCASLCSLMYLPHIHFDHGADYLMKNADRTLEILLYFVIAIITGAYSSSQRRLLGQLEKTNHELMEQTESLLSAEKSLRKQERLHALGLLGAGISHEIKNPLASLKGILEIVLEEPTEGTSQGLLKSEEQRKELGEIALSEVGRIQEILSRFMSLNQQEASPDEPVDIKEVCQNLIDLTRSQWKPKGINIKLILPTGPCTFHGPSGPLKQVLLNLLLNALAAAKVLIEIHLTCDDGKASILVRDDGAGVEPGSEEAIFEYFYTTRSDGNGLGLAISSELMNQLGGSLELLNPSTPTEFQMDFPLQFSPVEGGKHQVVLKFGESSVVDA